MEENISKNSFSTASAASGKFIKKCHTLDMVVHHSYDFLYSSEKCENRIYRKVVAYFGPTSP